MFGLREYVEAVGLISYGADINDIWRRAAVFVDKILKGVAARRPSRRAAHEVRAGHQPQDCQGSRASTIPQSRLLRANHVIE